MGGDAFLNAFMAEHPSGPVIENAPSSVQQLGQFSPGAAPLGSIDNPLQFGFVAPPAPPTAAPSLSPGIVENPPRVIPFQPGPRPPSGTWPLGPNFPPDFPPPGEYPLGVPELAPELPFIGTLGLLGGIGLAGIGASLAVGAPAPDEYGIGDIQALIDAGFYGNLVPQYQPPDNPAQTELAPAVAPMPAPETPNIGTVTVTAPPIEVPQIPAYVVPPFPLEVPGYVAVPRANPVGLPAPGRATLPAARPSAAPGTSPAGATAPLAGVVPLPAGLQVQSPATGAAPATGPVTPPAPSRLTAPVTGTSPSVSPLTDPQPGTQPLPPKPALAQLTQSGGVLGSVPPTTPRGKQDCKPTSNKQQQKKQQRKDRTVCHSGTYIERKHGLSKHAQRIVPCR